MRGVRQPAAAAAPRAPRAVLLAPLQPYREVPPRTCAGGIRIRRIEAYPHLTHVVCNRPAPQRRAGFVLSDTPRTPTPRSNPKSRQH